MMCRHWKRWSLLCVVIVALQAAATAQTPVTLPPDTGTSAPATTNTFSLKRMWLDRHHRWDDWPDAVCCVQVISPAIT